MSPLKVSLWIPLLGVLAAQPGDIFIRQLTHELCIRTHIYYGLSGENFEGLPIRSNQPKMLLQGNNTSEQLKTHHDAPVLIITPLASDLDVNLAAVRVLQMYLKDRQLTDILLMDVDVDGDTQSKVSYEDIFKVFWDAGFPHVLLFSGEDQLWSMKPFPRLKLTRTTLQDYLSERNSKDLMGVPLRVLVTNDPPHSFVNEAKSVASAGRYQGSIINIFKLFATHLNATFEAVPFPGLRRYRTAECLSLVMSNEADACGSIFLMTFRYPTSQPVRLNRVAIMAPFGNPIAKFHYFFRPFDPYVWLWTGLSVAYIALLGALLHRWRFGRWDVGQYLLLAVQSLLTRSLTLPQCSGGIRLLLLLLLFATGFVLSSLYVAQLSMMLTTKLYQRPIDSVADLRAANVSILLQQHNVRPNSVYGSTEELRERFLLVEEPLHKQRRDGLDPRFAYVDSEDRMDFYLYQQKFLRRPRMKKLFDPVGYTWAVQVIRQNWPLERLYNEHLQRLFETGLQEKLVADVHELAVRAGFLRFLPTQASGIDPLRLEDIVMAAMVLAGGHALAGICFLCELLLH
ncbi:uncharacterized protein LOC111076834 [Drosophila obscura]|uniref:uncharacterized protein LOC111076834 n=1 Tax=Drosophila obscura TaxID=7282 RepID=UPI001BB0E466|nr:uncharacterized protein LOC111076834 [Drosophila obscura]